MLIHECQYTHNQLLFIYINKYINKIPSFSCDSYFLSTVHKYWTSHVVKTKCYLPKFYYPWLLEPTSATFFSPVGSTSTGITATSTNLPPTSGNITSDNFNEVQTLGIVYRRGWISHCTHTYAQVSTTNLCTRLGYTVNLLISWSLANSLRVWHRLDSV